jgi:hypothetical protein
LRNFGGNRKVKNWKPIFFENSRVPRVLSFFAPIEISAISLFPFVFSRGTISESTKRHETIHFQQQLETGVLPFYLVYLWDYIKSRISGKTGREAYRLIRAEKEAYENEMSTDYLKSRPRYSWLKKI